jgi:hypothetical protein
MIAPALSPSHYRAFLEQNIGPLTKIISMAESDPGRLAAMREEFETLIKEYFADNTIPQQYLMTRASTR